MVIWVSVFHYVQIHEQFMELVCLLLGVCIMCGVIFHARKIIDVLVLRSNLVMSLFTLSSRL